MSPTLANLTSPCTPAVKRMGRFYITRELGRGSLATVYLAHDPVIDRDVALKTFNSKLTPPERKQYESQFINEARAAGRLSHPGIVTIYDATSEGGTTYIAMEYLEGRELSRMLDARHKFSIEDIASIVWKIADALDYAHKHGVVHRDIKPSNIFIIRDRLPKIIDFGIARAPNRVPDPHATDDNPYTLFEPNNLLGTPNYMSPEQALGREVDHRTDIYSLGAMMYEMLTGKKPFHTTDTEQLLQMIAYKAPPAPHELNPTIPPILSQIAMKAMSKRPEKRYQAGEFMVLDLKRFLNQERSDRRSRKSISAEGEADDSDSEARPTPKTKERSYLSLVSVSGMLFALAGISYVWLS